jgi:spore germination cell wall hydrolase CwlJ-like protein
MPKLSDSDRAELTKRLMAADAGDYDKVEDTFMQELGRRTNGLPMPTTQASPAPTTPAAAPAPPPTAAPTSPISPDVSYLAKTAFGEGEGEGQEGQRAIMHVIANRLAKKPGSSVQSIVQAPNQFESWASGNPRQPVMQQMDLNDPQYANLVTLAQAVLAGKDPDNTKGSTLFYNPKKADPGWAHKAHQTMVLGDHRFMSE